MGYVWLIAALASSTAGELFFKAGMLRVGKSPQNLRKLPRFWLRTYTNPLVILSIVITIIWIVTSAIATSILPLSYMVALGTSIPLMLITVFCLPLFKEKVSRLSWLGIVMICVGTVPLGIAMGLGQGT